MTCNGWHRSMPADVRYEIMRSRRLHGQTIINHDAIDVHIKQ